MYNLDMPFTVFYGIIDAIPDAWKNKIKQHDQLINVKRTCNATSATRSIYSTILRLPYTFRGVFRPSYVARPV